MESPFRLRIDADAARQDQRLTFIDEGGPDRESSLAVLVQWHDREAQPVLEPAFESFVREYRDATSIVSPGSFLEKLVQDLDAACGGLPVEALAGMEFAVALASGRGLYLLRTTGFDAECSLGDGVPQPLVSSLRVRVKDLSPGALRNRHLWSDALVDRLRLVRVFFEDEDRASVDLWLRETVEEAGEQFPPVHIQVEKVAAPEASLVPAVPIDEAWPDLEASGRRDRRTLSYAAMALVGLLVVTAGYSLWRWHRMSSASSTPGAEALFSETVDSSLDGERRDGDATGETRSGKRGKDDGRAIASGPAASLDILWSKRHRDWVTSSPRLAHGSVVYGCRDGHLYARDREGNVKWDFASGAGIGATPAVDDGRVFCGNYAGRAFALADKDGTLEWSVELGSRLVGSPAAGKKRVFFSTQAGEIVALEKKNGKIAWRHPAGGKLRATPLAVDGELYAAGGDGQLVCLKQSNGDVKWAYDAGSPVASTPLLAEGRLVFGCKDGTVHAVSVKKGEPQWQVRTRGAVSATPAYDDDVVFVGSSDKRLYAIRLKNGEIAWSFATRAAILASPCVQDGKVYLTAYDRHTYVLAAEDGRPVAKALLKAPIYSSPLVAEGRIYCGSNDGTLYCLADVRH